MSPGCDSKLQQVQLPNIVHLVSSPYTYYLAPSSFPTYYSNMDQIFLLYLSLFFRFDVCKAHWKLFIIVFIKTGLLK